MTAKCLYCSGPLVWARGWGHMDGGGFIMVRCDGCGYRGSPSPTPTRCPSCQSVALLRDDHVATPTRS